MDFDRFCEILNEQLFAGLKRELLEKIARNPQRFDILFRPTLPDSKLLQFLLQSREIRLGTALGLVVKELLAGAGYRSLGTHVQDNEQKVRDDRDTSARQGITRAFQSKVRTLRIGHGASLVGFLYFIDPSFGKNAGFYSKELERIAKEEKVEVRLLYGKDLFDDLGIPDLWQRMVEWLGSWKQTVPMLREVNFDTDPKASFEELKDMPPRLWLRLLDDDRLWQQGIIPALFRSGATLRLLLSDFQQRRSAVYQDLASKLSSRILSFYSRS